MKELENVNPTPFLISMAKYMVISIAIYPWYYVIMKSGRIDRLMSYIFPIENSGDLLAEGHPYSNPNPNE